MTDQNHGERFCPQCKQSKHHSRFRSRKRDPHGSMWVEFNLLCKSCEKINRIEKKNEDRATHIVEERAGAHARKAGVPKSFFLVDMNYQALTPFLRAMMGTDARCLCCGHEFEGEPDIHIEHREPPRHRQDWARLHARNLSLACASCNGDKINKPYAVWLDEEEDERLSNERHPTVDPLSERPHQLYLFDEPIQEMGNA